MRLQDMPIRVCMLMRDSIDCNCYESSICKLLSLSKMLGYHHKNSYSIWKHLLCFKYAKTLLCFLVYKKFPKTFKSTATFTLNFQVLGHPLQFRMSRHYSLLFKGNVFVVLLQLSLKKPWLHKTIVHNIYLLLFNRDFYIIINHILYT